MPRLRQSRAPRRGAGWGVPSPCGRGPGQSSDKMSAPTDSQRRAISAAGNVLVVAGAGTGKTRTLVERCLMKLAGGCSLENILMVTFTDAAAVEMRKRIREGVEKAAEIADPAARAWLDQQLALLDAAHISTQIG